MDIAHTKFSATGVLCDEKGLGRGGRWCRIEWELRQNLVILTYSRV